MKPIRDTSIYWLPLLSWKKGNYVGTPGVKEKGHESFSEKGSDCDPSQLRPAECTERIENVNQSQVNSLNSPALSVHGKLANGNHVK